MLRAKAARRALDADAPVVVAAVAGNAAAIVTGDRDLLDDLALRARLASRGVDLVTPEDLLGLLDRWPSVCRERAPDRPSHPAVTRWTMIRGRAGAQLRRATQQRWG